LVQLEVGPHVGHLGNLSRLCMLISTPLATSHHLQPLIQFELSYSY